MLVTEYLELLTLQAPDKTVLPAPAPQVRWGQVTSLDEMTCESKCGTSLPVQDPADLFLRGVWDGSSPISPGSGVMDQSRVPLGF